MSKIPVLNAIRLIPRETDYLERKAGSRGEIFFDRDSNSLRLYDGSQTGGYTLAKSDLSNITNSDFAAKASVAGIGGGAGSGEITIAADDSTQRILSGGEVFSILGGDGISTTTNDEGALTVTNTNNGFATFSVSGQSDVDATQLSDSVTLVEGSNVIITTDAVTKSITISASAGASTNSFNTISVGGQDNVVADSTTDTLTLVAGSGMSITTNAGTDTITIASTLTSGVDVFSSLTDAASAGLTVDEIYMPAIVRLEVTNSGASAYLFNSHYSGGNPTIYAINRTTISFKLNATGHPFLIQNASGVNYNTGLVHVATDGTVSTGAAAQGKESGTLYWQIPSSISGGYRYQCQTHAAMVGSITIKDFVSI